MTDYEESGLEKLFASYRAACPEVEPSVNFMPELWQKIEARQSFGSVFARLSRMFAAASAAVCLLLLLLNMVSTSRYHPAYSTYTDALMAEHSAEQTYYTEAIYTSTSVVQPVGAIRH
jgi:hypothetical protein